MPRRTCGATSMSTTVGGFERLLVGGDRPAIAPGSPPTTSWPLPCLGVRIHGRAALKILENRTSEFKWSAIEGSSTPQFGGKQRSRPWALTLPRRSFGNGWSALNRGPVGQHIVEGERLGTSSLAVYPPAGGRPQAPEDTMLGLVVSHQSHQSLRVHPKRDIQKPLFHPRSDKSGPLLTQVPPASSPGVYT